MPATVMGPPTRCAKSDRGSGFDDAVFEQLLDSSGIVPDRAGIAIRRSA